MLFITVYIYKYNCVKLASPNPRPHRALTMPASPRVHEKGLRVTGLRSGTANNKQSLSAQLVPATFLVRRYVFHSPKAGRS